MWYFPMHSFVASECVDVDDLNLNFSAIQSILSGGLGEQNFASQAMVGVEGQWATYIGLDIHHIKVELDPYDTANLVDIQQSTAWTKVTGTSATYVFRGGKSHIIYSFGISNNPGSAGARQSGLQFAISVDGVVYPDCMIGSGDMTNDLIRDSVPAGNPSIDEATGPGVKAAQLPLVVELGCYIGPGEHTVALVSRNLKPMNAGVYQKIHSLEGIIIGMNA